MKTRAAREVRHKATHPKRRARPNKSTRKTTIKRQQKTVQIPAGQAGIPATNPASLDTARKEAGTGTENAMTVFEVVEFGVAESPSETVAGDEFEIAEEELEGESEEED